MSIDLFDDILSGSLDLRAACAAVGIVLAVRLWFWMVNGLTNGGGKE